MTVDYSIIVPAYNEERLIGCTIEGMPEFIDKIVVIDDASVDLDGDNLTNLMEFGYDTNPRIADTDADGFDDGTEVEAGSDPLDPLSVPTEGGGGLGDLGDGAEGMATGLGAMSVLLFMVALGDFLLKRKGGS